MGHPVPPGWFQTDCQLIKLKRSRNASECTCKERALLRTYRAKTFDQLAVKTWDVVALGQALRAPPHAKLRTETRNAHSQYYVSGINIPWHAPVACHFTGIFSDYQELGLQAENRRFRVAVLR